MGGMASTHIAASMRTARMLVTAGMRMKTGDCRPGPAPPSLCGSSHHWKAYLQEGSRHGWQGSGRGHSFPVEPSTSHHVIAWILLAIPRQPLGVTLRRN